MAKPFLKQKAIELRGAGYSYSRIKRELGVGKGTLSAWLQGLPLSQERIRELRDWNEIRIERYRETRRKKREAILKEIYSQESSKIFPLSQREEFLCGLFLYWGEGTKTGNGILCLANTDYRMMRFFLQWITLALGVPKEKVFIRLHLYSDMSVEKEQEFWSKTLNIPSSQFKKPYVKKSTLVGLTYKNGFGHGTCNMMVSDAILRKRVLMGIKSIGDLFEDGNLDTGA